MQCGPRYAYRGRNSTFRDSMSVPQLVFLPRPPIAGNAGIFTPRVETRVGGIAQAMTDVRFRAKRKSKARSEPHRF